MVSIINGIFTGHNENDQTAIFRGHHVIIWLLLLQHHPHSFHVIPSKTPIPRSLQIPKKQLALQPNLDSPNRARDLLGHEILTPPRRFVVEQYPIARENPVRFPVIHCVPMCRAFRRGVRRSRVKRRHFLLRRRRRPEHFGRSSLVVPNMVAPSGGDVGSDSFEETEGPGGDNIGGVIWDLE